MDTYDYSNINPKYIIRIFTLEFMNKMVKEYIEELDYSTLSDVDDNLMFTKALKTFYYKGDYINKDQLFIFKKKNYEKIAKEILYLCYFDLLKYLYNKMNIFPLDFQKQYYNYVYYVKTIRKGVRNVINELIYTKSIYKFTKHDIIF